jgi:hypothetical protein
MRLTARITDRQQVGSLVDSLKNMGIDRSDMIIFDLDEPERTKQDEILKEETLVQSKTESISADPAEAFIAGYQDKGHKEGIIVAVEVPKHSAEKVKDAMVQSGAVEITRD